MKATKSYFKRSSVIQALFAFVLFTFVYSSAHVTHAGVKEWLFEKIADVIPEVDITRTVNNMIAEALTGVPLSLTVQRTADEVFNCGIVHFADTLGDDALAAERLAELNAITSAVAAEIITECRLEVAEYDPTVCDFNNVEWGTARGSGSLLAMGVKMDELVDSGVSPVNLAVYFKDIARRLPIARDTAFAATYPIYGENLVLEIWKITRNVSYGVVSVSLIVVGIMIMMRKKINPQTTITFQNALPRLVISLVLITFSYPIGATIASMCKPAIELSKGFFYTPEELLALAGQGGLLNSAVMVFGLLAGGFPGITGAVMAIFFFIVLIVVWVLALIKVVMGYLRIIFATITAPFSFAMGAVPGKENAITDWFKNVAVEVIAIAATFFMIRLANFVGIESISATFDTSGGNILEGAISDDNNLFSRLVVFAATPLIMIICLTTAVKMRNNVRGWILGDKAKRR